jgi:lipid-binding SYLF domain-containing protein
MIPTRRTLVASGLALAALTCALAPAAEAASAAKLTAAGRRALETLQADVPKSRLFARNAKAVLVFPRIYKGGFVVGAQTGDGVLFEHGKVAAYYNISAASFGLQAGGQAFSYALFFMSDGALAYIRKSDGWSLGTGPSVVVVDQGESREANTATLSHDVYAFPFAEKGLMAGIDIKGSKITRIHPK